MDLELKDWIIKQHEQMPPRAKQTFLRTLKFRSDRALQIISRDLPDWVLDFIIQTGNTEWSYENDHDALELLQAFQGHFAKEMEAITE